jgi:hypothetical protein
MKHVRATVGLTPIVVDLHTYTTISVCQHSPASPCGSSTVDISATVRGVVHSKDASSALRGHAISRPSSLCIR